MHYKNLTLIGTSHIAKQSLEEVEHAIEKQKPDIIALELDRRRFYALTHNIKRKLRLSDIRRIGIKGFIFNIIGAWVENKLGKLVGVKPGSDMLKAISLARKHKTRIALIDQDIQITLARISQTFGWKEKFNLLIDILKGLIFRKSELKALGITKLDLTKVPSKTLIKKLTKRVKQRYPNLYKVLVEERNHVMAKNLQSIMNEYPDKKIIAVIGAGHEEELIELIKKPDISYSFKVN